MTDFRIDYYERLGFHECKVTFNGDSVVRTVSQDNPHEDFESLISDVCIKWSYEETVHFHKDIAQKIGLEPNQEITLQALLVDWSTQNIAVFVDRYSDNDEENYYQRFPVGTSLEDVKIAAISYFAPICEAAERERAEQERQKLQDERERIQYCSNLCLGATIVGLEPGNLVMRDRNGNEFRISHTHSVWNYGDESESWLVVKATRLPNNRKAYEQNT